MAYREEGARIARSSGFGLGGICHEATQLLRLECIRLHLALRIVGLESQHFLDFFGVGERARQSESSLGILLGEANGFVLNRL